MTVHSPRVRDINTRGTVGNTVVHMHQCQTIQNLTLRRVETKKELDLIQGYVSVTKVCTFSIPHTILYEFGKYGSSLVTVEAVVRHVDTPHSD